MYEKTENANVPTDVPPIQGAYSRIKSALITCHDIQGVVETKIGFLYKLKPDSPPNPSEKREEPRTFHDHLLLVADMAEHLRERMEQAKNDFNQAI